MTHFHFDEVFTTFSNETWNIFRFTNITSESSVAYRDVIVVAVSALWLSGESGRTEMRQKCHFSPRLLKTFKCFGFGKEVFQRCRLFVQDLD